MGCGNENELNLDKCFSTMYMSITRSKSQPAINFKMTDSFFRGCIAPCYSFSDHAFFWSGRGSQERRESGVGFAIEESITRKLEHEPVSISDRLMTIILPLGKNTYVTIISAYAPTMTNPDDVKENFYSCLRTVIRKLPPGDKLVLIGDFNARVGTDAKRWPGVIGYHDIGK